MKKYDAIIIGAGQGGIPLAKKLAHAGWKTALIEKGLVGGTCVNDGCTPTKTMIASAKVAYLAKHSKAWGITIDNYQVDMAAIIQRKNEIVGSSREGSEKNLKETKGLDLLFGEASFTGHKTIAVALHNGDKQILTAETICIDTGAKAIIPQIEGINDINYLTSTTILDLEQLPEHLLIVGAGYIALEFGQLYKRLGSKVTLLEKGEQILSREDTDIGQALKKILEEEGITIHTRTRIKKLRQSREGSIIVQVDISGKSIEITCSHLLVAAGRLAQTEGLHLEKTGVKTDEKGHIVVNEWLETSMAGIYALGDVKGGPAFTHVSYNDYVIVSKNLLEKATLSSKNRLLPYCIFTDPQLARVGLSEKEAIEKGYKIKIATLSMEHVARARETGETRGFMKAIVEADTKKILGAAILGAQGGEIMTVLQVAMMGGLTYEQIRFGMFAHPTFSESLNNLFMSLEE